MDSIYVTKKVEDLDFEVLMNKVDTVFAISQKEVRQGPGFIYYLYFVSKKYSVKLRYYIDNFIEGSCSCPDYNYRRKEKKEFCKHILAVIDFLNQEKEKKD